MLLTKILVLLLVAALEATPSTESSKPGASSIVQPKPVNEAKVRLGNMIQSVLLAMKNTSILSLGMFYEKFEVAANIAESHKSEVIRRTWLDCVKELVKGGGAPGRQMAAFLMVPVVANSGDDLSVLSELLIEQKDMQLFKKEVITLRKRCVFNEDVAAGGFIDSFAYSTVDSYYKVMDNMKDQVVDVDPLVERLVPVIPVKLSSNAKAVDVGAFQVEITKSTKEEKKKQRKFINPSGNPISSKGKKWPNLFKSR